MFSGRSGLAQAVEAINTRQMRNRVGNDIKNDFRKKFRSTDWGV
ncbi:MAG: hypothetical protein ACI9UQ_001591 [Candidatus Krumholzibacteriia bacterium]